MMNPHEIAHCGRSLLAMLFVGAMLWGSALYWGRIKQWQRFTIRPVGGPLTVPFISL